MTQEALKLALEALNHYEKAGLATVKTIDAITAIKEALAKPEQEPVAWMYVNTDGECEQIEYGEPYRDPSVIPLYITPPQRTWVGLDHHDKKKFSSWLDHKTDDEVFTAIEDRLKELNT